MMERQRDRGPGCGEPRIRVLACQNSWDLHCPEDIELVVWVGDTRHRRTLRLDRRVGRSMLSRLIRDSLHQWVGATFFKQDQEEVMGALDRTLYPILRGALQPARPESQTPTTKPQAPTCSASISDVDFDPLGLLLHGNPAEKAYVRSLLPGVDTHARITPQL